jgi:hypothetical protein
MRRTFICSPFSGNVERNIRYAQFACNIALLSGGAPFAPHLMYPQFLDEKRIEDREAGIKCGLAFLAACDEVLVMDRYGISPGMKREIKEARRLRLPVRYIQD